MDQATLDLINSAIETIRNALEYRPLWLALIIVSLTQGFKMAAGHLFANDALHRLVMRAVSSLIGAVGGYFLLTQAGEPPINGVIFGIAISAAISILYVPIVRWLNRGRKGSFRRSLGEWLSGG